MAGFEDMAVVDQPAAQRSCHLGITEHAGPFAKAQIGGFDHAGALVVLREQVERRPAP